VSRSFQFYKNKYISKEGHHLALVSLLLFCVNSERDCNETKHTSLKLKVSNNNEKLRISATAHIN